ncbi:DNA-directed RNA polymerases I and III subunit RPAC2-like [Acanthaster planci]|uniref:DNA-directed RNA polymerases I and III subunit RPAC2 n=1 Tax=Acanthaster planci TaxID=133434 RepID=A0A8B7Z3T2_ACAPL|nr:DNA-directed RNA polymerases I and III subunit RPAC2-like [Acanthaster planci]
MADDKEKPGRLSVIQMAGTELTGDNTCLTFVLHNEDHTLGNALRYMIMKNPDVEFCGYSIPHPSENKVNLRIQTKGSPAVDVFKKGLSDLTALSEHVLETFEISVQNFKAQQQEEDMDIQ